MSLEHKDVVRMNDEYFCTACGKSWAVDDKDPPFCGTGLARGVSPGFRTVQQIPRGIVDKMGGREWPTPMGGILQAFIVNDETMQRALLVYAPDKNSARRYIEAMTKRADLEIRRIGAMDQYARGLSSYCEANPLTLRIAKNTSRLNVVSPASWRL